jgi:hypothetical protein
MQSITNMDPRHADGTNYVGSAVGCTVLSPEQASLEELRKSCPMRNVVSQIRKLVEFGAFVDFGGEIDGMIHSTRLGRFLWPRYWLDRSLERIF